jgi:uncharacterized membrane protein YeaQ/YmgE (transglycosylase-associated protein family)
MSILWWIIIGGLAGWIASALMGERQGCVMDVVVGVVGALLGGALFSWLGGVGFTGFNFWSLVVAVVGAALFIALLRAFRGPKGPVA